jgi:hypothetical protein
VKSSSISPFERFVVERLVVEPRSAAAQQAISAYCSVRGPRQYRLSAEPESRAQRSGQMPGNRARPNLPQQDFWLNI